MARKLGAGFWVIFLVSFIKHSAGIQNFKRQGRIAHSSDTGSEPLFQFISLEREDEYMEIKQRQRFEILQTSTFT